MRIRGTAMIAIASCLLFFPACGRKNKRVASVPSAPRSMPAAPGRTVAKAAPVPLPVGYAEEGIASWYGIPYHGRKAADGEIYDMETLVAAHRTMPFNTWLKVTNARNGKTVTVRIIDRGPFVEGRIIDLSKAAARQIELLGPGTGLVRLEVIAALPAANVSAPAGTPTVDRPTNTAPANPPLANPPLANPPLANPPPANTVPTNTVPTDAPSNIPTAASSNAPANAPTSPPATAEIPSTDFYAVQVGAFTVYANAEKARVEYAQRYGFAQLAIRQGRVTMWRVLVGKEPSVETAQKLAVALNVQNKEVFVVRLDAPAPSSPAVAPQP